MLMIIFSYNNQSTNSTVFATAPRESMKASCLKEIARNDTLLNVTKNGEKLAEKIVSITCPGECSSHGVCVKGAVSQFFYVILKGHGHDFGHSFFSTFILFNALLMHF